VRSRAGAALTAAALAHAQDGGRTHAWRPAATACVTTFGAAVCFASQHGLPGLHRNSLAVLGDQRPLPQQPSPYQESNPEHAAGVVWVGDLAPEHKLAPAWQPALAWLDTVTLHLALDPGDGTALQALQAAALADLDARRDEAGGPGRPAPPAGRPGQGPRQGGRRPQGAAPVGVAVRAGPACRAAVAEVVAAFPPLLPATAEGERPGAPAGPAASVARRAACPGPKEGSLRMMRFACACALRVAHCVRSLPLCPAEQPPA